MATGSANATSGKISPFPLHTGHAPLELKLNHCTLTPFSLANNLRISSITPVYVAGVERADVPIGFWSMTMQSGYRSTNSCRIRLLLPEPATPVTAVRIPLGISTDTSFKLFLDTCSSEKLCAHGSGWVLSAIFSRIQAAVNVSVCFNCSTVPWKITCPPCAPASGPISTT